MILRNCLLCELTAVVRSRYQSVALDAKAIEVLASDHPTVETDETAKRVDRLRAQLVDDLARVSRHPHRERRA